MTSQEKMDIISSFQDNPMIHPLTCGINSSHRNLVPINCDDDEVILKCLDCGYKQHIDDDFIGLLAKLDANQRQFADILRNMFKEN